MKKKLVLALIIVCLLVSATVFCVSAITSASEDVTLEIKACNLTFGVSIYIDYAVATTGVSDADSVELLIWDAAQENYAKGSEKWSYSPNSGTKNVAGVPCKVFTFDDIIARQLADDFYAVAYVKEGDTEYYSEPLKYSVLRYAYSKLGYIPGGESDKPTYKALLTQTLEYGAAVQTHFNYNTDRLADAKYYLVSVDGGALPDGFDWGLYKENDKVIISAPEKNAEGGTFAGWVDGNGNKVYDDATTEITVTAKNETYTATYVKYSEGLEFDSNGDGTCCLLGMGDCNDTVLVIPPVSPEGDTVTEIDGSAFVGEAITSVSLPGTITDIGRKAFNGCTSLTDVYYDGTAEEWATVDIGTGNDPILNATMHFNEPAVETFTVTFVDYDGTVLKTETVEEGKGATAPTASIREGYTFVGWDKEFDEVTEDITVKAVYVDSDPAGTYTVTFYDYDGTTVLGTSTVTEGKAATPPTNPSKSGATFLGWNGNYANVTKNESVVAVYDDSKNVFTVESATGSVGDAVTLLVSVDGTVKTCGFDITIYYDNAILELVSYDSDLDLDVVVNTEYLDNGILLNFSAATEKTKSREIIELTFRIKDTTADATSVYVEMTSIKELDGSTIIDSTCEFADGVVTIQ